ncbi:hypothetical protein PQZ72_01945 [Candidatus Pelagibacter sp.]|nr:hypothetical protein [Candidatus Pelagibacter sp.]MDC6476018.1 hypothetical protein [Candidatus Pelagibacter sp.]
MSLDKHGDKHEDKLSIKFTDYAINKHETNFDNIKGKSAGVKLENCGIKGLKIIQYKKTKRKYFCQNFWFEGKTDVWTAGQFIKDKFGIKECRTKVVAIMKTHTDDNGLWIKSPKITAKQQKQRISKAEVENRQMITITTAIERFYKAGCPKMKREGTLTGKSIMDVSLHLIGKNKRTAHIEHDDDVYGNGHITFRPCKQFNTKKPESWDDLFEKFPSGHGTLTEKNGKKLIGVSMYDHPVFSKYLIEELTPGLINSYLDEHSPSWGTKRKMIYALQCVWHNSKKYMGRNRPLDPTTKEALEVKSCGVSKSKNSKYNKKKNTQDKMEVMWTAFQQINIEKKHPFQAECYMLEMACGKHHTELSKLKKADVYPPGKFDNQYGIDNIIVLPSGTIKGREENYITITKPVQIVLDMIENLYKRPELMQYKFIPWLFPTTRSSSKSWLIDGQINQTIINSKKTRIRDTRECWKTMEAMTGIRGSVPRLFRKDFGSKSVSTLGSSSTAIKLTGHTKTSTLDKHYDIHDKDQIREYAHKVADSFTWGKKDNSKS